MRVLGQPWRGEVFSGSVSVESSTLEQVVAIHPYAGYEKSHGIQSIASSNGNALFGICRLDNTCGEGEGIWRKGTRGTLSCLALFASTQTMRVN